MIEQTTYIIIAAMIVVVVVAGFYIYESRPATLGSSGSVSSTIETTANAPAFTSYTTTTSSSTTSTSTTALPTYCEPKNTTTASIYNGDFGTGTYYGWTTTGSAFGKVPLNLNNANANGTYYEYQWSNYGGQYAATSYHQTTSPIPGNLSASFVVAEPYLNFQIYSPASPLLYVEIIPSSGQRIINYYNTLNGSGTGRFGEFASASINVSMFMCQSVTVRVVSNANPTSGEGTFIAVTNFYLSQSQSQTSGISDN